LFLFTFGIVDGSESLSFPFWFVIVSLLTASYSSEIHATFVKTVALVVFGVATTVHSISIVSESKVFPSYAFKFCSPVVVNVALFVDSSYATV